MLSRLELLISRYRCIKLVVYIIYISLYIYIYFLLKHAKQSINSSTECRVFHNVTFFGS